jgi:probable rRNA maturation factor
MSEGILFHKENVKFRLNYQKELRSWIKAVLIHYGYRANTINYIFCSDKYLLKINKQYLKHNYFTDIITFNNSTERKKPEADIFISVDRIKENALRYNTTFPDELHRVIIHGALHLAGFNDKTKAQQLRMREAEDLWLGKRKFVQK